MDQCKKWTFNVKFPIFVRMAAKQGWVTELGVICPFLYTTFRLKRVNNEKILLLPHTQGVHN